MSAWHAWALAVVAALLVIVLGVIIGEVIHRLGRWGVLVAACIVLLFVGMMTWMIAHMLIGQP